MTAARTWAADSNGYIGCDDPGLSCNFAENQGFSRVGRCPQPNSTAAREGFSQ